MRTFITEAPFFLYLPVIEEGDFVCLFFCLLFGWISISYIPPLPSSLCLTSEISCLQCFEFVVGFMVLVI